MDHIVGIVPGEDIQECGFSCSVPADYADFLISLEIICELVQIAAVAIIEAEVLAVYDLGSHSCGTFHSLHADLLLSIYLRRPVLEVIERVHTIAGLSSAGAWRASDPFEFAAQNVPYLVGLCIIVCNPFLSFFEEVLVVTFIYIYGAAVHFHDDVADAVKEVAVVSHHQKGAA